MKQTGDLTFKEEFNIRSIKNEIIIFQATPTQDSPTLAMPALCAYAVCCNNQTGLSHVQPHCAMKQGRKGEQAREYCYENRDILPMVLFFSVGGKIL